MARCLGHVDPPQARWASTERSPPQAVTLNRKQRRHLSTYVCTTAEPKLVEGMNTVALPQFTI